MTAAPEWLAWAQTIQAAATFGMTGVIWLVQLVQYPGFARVGNGDFPGYHAHHCRAIGWVVGPLMILELATAVILAYAAEPFLFWRGMLGALIAIWLSTALLQGPLHKRLSREGPQPDLVRTLVRTNWIRTLLWSARSLGLILFYARGWA